VPGDEAFNKHARLLLRCSSTLSGKVAETLNALIFKPMDAFNTAFETPMLEKSKLLKEKLVDLINKDPRKLAAHTLLDDMDSEPPSKEVTDTAILDLETLLESSRMVDGVAGASTKALSELLPQLRDVKLWRQRKQCTTSLTESLQKLEAAMPKDIAALDLEEITALLSPPTVVTALSESFREIVNVEAECKTHVEANLQESTSKAMQRAKVMLACMSAVQCLARKSEKEMADFEELKLVQRGMTLKELPKAISNALSSSEPEPAEG
jgi:hypothetical protein